MLILATIWASPLRVVQRHVIVFFFVVVVVVVVCLFVCFFHPPRRGWLLTLTVRQAKHLTGTQIKEDQMP